LIQIEEKKEKIPKPRRRETLGKVSQRRPKQVNVPVLSRQTTCRHPTPLIHVSIKKHLSTQETVKIIYCFLKLNVLISDMT